MKPYVICLMHSSLDGRTHPSRWRPKGAGTDWFEKIHDELGGDAWVIGRVTGSEFAKGKPYPATAGETFPRPKLVRAARCENLRRRARRAGQDRLGPVRHRR
ncbi:hypothetical protein ACVWZ3_007922 [Bradyrhizobium sp. i1.3.6]